MDMSDLCPLIPLTCFSNLRMPHLLGQSVPQKREARQGSASHYSCSLDRRSPHTCAHPSWPCLSHSLPTHFPRDTENLGTVPHHSQNSGEVSEPPPPQVLVPLRSTGTGPILKSATTRSSKPAGPRLPCDLF